MAKHEYFKNEFDKLAVNGVIGQPDGTPAHAYIRVSSDEQGEEGRSGLPRQIQHIHEVSRQKHLAITWDRVFADDFTGFEISRPELDRLRDEYRSQQRRASIVVMEYLDRLSRNADWHQGFLLDEMQRAGIEPVFWKAYTSRIERVVMGIVSQDGMELSLERMADGIRKKAEDGRVTGRRVNYGFKFVDEHGNEGSRARKHTHYAILDDQASIVRLIYERVVAGDSLGSIAKSLDADHVPPPKNTKTWVGSLLPVLVHNEVYKGDYIAHRWVYTDIQKPRGDGVSMRTVRGRIARPESEWIHVPVPALVSPELWQAANDMLAKNKQMAGRNVNRNERYLLTGLVTCTDCGTTFRGRTQHPSPKNGRKIPTRSYTCRYSQGTPRYMLDAHGRCSQRSIAARLIEDAVWSVVCTALLDANVLLKALEADYFDDHNASINRQIHYLECEIAAKQGEDEKLYRAYIADVFDEVEFGERRKALKAESLRLTNELNNLYPQRANREQFEAQKQLVVQFSERLSAMNAHVDPPFEVKQRILKMLVDRIMLNSRERWFRLEGVLRGTYTFENSPARKTSYNVKFQVVFSLNENRVVSIDTLPNFPLNQTTKDVNSDPDLTGGVQL